MRFVRKYVIPALALGICLIPSAARADFVIDTITGIETGNVIVESAEPVFGFTGFLLAAQFTSAVNLPLLDAQVFVKSVNPGINNLFNLTIAQDLNNLPGAQLAQIGTDLAAPAKPGAVTSNSSTTPLQLVAGTSYWLEITPSRDSRTSISWFLNGSPATASAGSDSADGVGWFGTPGDNGYQFRIDAGAPEPAFSIPIALCGCALLLWRVRSKSAAFPVIKSTQG